MFNELCNDIDELTDMVSSYVTFCEDCVIPKKIWVLGLKITEKPVKQKKRKAFREGNIAELNSLKREIKIEI